MLQPFLRVASFALLLMVDTGCRDASHLDTEPADVSPSVVRAIEPKLARISVSSSALRSVGYDPARRILEIEFSSGDVYHYFDVPESIHAGLMRAESHGRYFNRRIKKADYRCVRLPRSTTPEKRIP